jgi:hypothetical protein
MTMTDSVTLIALIDEMTTALCEVDRLMFDEELPHDLGPPASSRQLAVFERKLGAPLPPSYRKFLELHNGWDNLVGDAKILAAEDHDSDWVKEKLQALGILFYEVGKDPLASGSVPVMLGTDARGFLLVDPGTVRPDGEMDFVAYDLGHEEKRFPDFEAFLRRKLYLLRRMIADETQGKKD